ncbi:dolichyl-phosphate-mannose-protein mannosyltransferase [Thermodesulfitimonas autotrophica]|uniref:Dolichyl-phosphate-mannose-protein mannosyltransferase n=2 Tax=Thermodesulfitimonas autotrophica TaxID=1894989 RepID=A0A3N5BSK8_9THEO|nr:dolichyl-phosphate-mannose-protein mannosyltransferase [Thermodesulfitimonas autotrophica]
MRGRRKSAIKGEKLLSMVRDTRKELLTYLILAAVLLGALVVRVVFIHHWGSSLALGSDDVGYTESARRLVSNHVFSYWRPRLSPEPALGPSAYMPPGYPLFLSFFIYLWGDNAHALAAARYAQAFLMVGSVYLTYRLGRELAGRWAGLGAAALVAFYPPLILINGLLLTETLFTFLLISFVGLWVQTKPADARRHAVLGVVSGLATLVRPTGVLLLFAAAGRLALCLMRRKIGVRALWPALGALLLTFCLVLSPWWVRNALVFHRFIPLTASGGNPLLLGTYVNLEGIKYGWHPSWPVGKDPMETGELHTALAIKRLRDGFQNDFWRYLDWYTRGKFRLLWGRAFVWGGEDKLPRGVTLPYHYVLVAAGGFGLLYGLWRCFPGSGRIFAVLLLFTLVHLATYAHCRYALPLLPLLAATAFWPLKVFAR